MASQKPTQEKEERGGHWQPQCREAKEILFEKVAQVVPGCKKNLNFIL